MSKQRPIKKQLDAIAALLTEKNVEDAAAKAGMSARTLYRWLREEPDFIAEYRKARREATSQAISQLQRGSSDAARTLLDIVRSSKEKASDRVAAARNVLQFAISGVELDDLVQRLETLEAALKESTKDA